MTRDELEGLCARLERELEESRGWDWATMDGPVPTSTQWRVRHEQWIAEIRARLDPAEALKNLTAPQMLHLVAASNGIVYCTDRQIRDELIEKGLATGLSRLVKLTPFGLDMRDWLMKKAPEA
jgi:DNA-binding transcriptional LysR family regulator